MKKFNGVTVAAAVRSLINGGKPEEHLEPFLMAGDMIPCELIRVLHSLARPPVPGPDFVTQRMIPDSWERARESAEELAKALESGDIIAALNACLLIKCWAPDYQRKVYLQKAVVDSKRGKKPGKPWLNQIRIAIEKGDKTLHAITVSLKAQDPGLPDPSAMRKAYRKAYPVGQ